LFSSPVQNQKGTEEISRGKEKIVWSTLVNAIEDRVKNGEFTIVNATLSKISDWRKYLDLCKKHNAELICLDFRGIEKEELLRRDKNREEVKQVGEKAIDKITDQINSLVIPKDIPVIKPIEWDDFFALEFQNLNKFKKINHFGDIHGNPEPLKEFLKDGMQNDEFYIFVGDFVDRGNKNAEVLEFIFSIMGKKNVILLEGNHEIPLRQWANGTKISSGEFNRYTKPELESKNVSMKKTKTLVDMMLKTHFAYEYDGKKVFVTHGGIAKLPKTKYEIPMTQYIRGVGNYEVEIDRVFTELNRSNEYQIHGHRNIHKFQIRAAENSFNLEGRIEYGEYLRIVTLNKENGFVPIEVKNNHSSKRLQPGVIKEFNNHELIKKLREDKGIMENKFKNDISSYNFKEAVFFDGDWNERRIKTRGLFIDTETSEIIIRSYDKFFNLGELEETKRENLKKTLEFPLQTYLKENGFLGLVGYQTKKNRLVLASKKTTQGKFKEMFRDIWNDTVTPEKEEEIKEWIKNKNITLVFEVIDVENDPHMIKYEKSKIVLLDAVYREEEFRKVSYEELKEFAKKVNLEVKQETHLIQNFEEFEKFIKEQSKYENKIEGYVIEDSSGYQFKLKLPYYSYWKWARTEIGKMKTGKETNEEFFKHPYSKKYNVKKIFVEIIEKYPAWVEEEDMVQIAKYCEQKQLN
jgi:predicted phosphodiesterase